MTFQPTPEMGFSQEMNIFPEGEDDLSISNAIVQPPYTTGKKNNNKNNE